jgi:hypothetical protein
MIEKPPIVLEVSPDLYSCPGAYYTPGLIPRAIIILIALSYAVYWMLSLVVVAQRVRGRALSPAVNRTWIGSIAFVVAGWLINGILFEQPHDCEFITPIWSIHGYSKYFVLAAIAFAVGALIERKLSHLDTTKVG